MRIKGIGEEYAKLLIALGYGSLEALSKEKSNDLYQKIKTIDKSKMRIVFPKIKITLLGNPKRKVEKTERITRKKVTIKETIYNKNGFINKKPVISLK